MRGPPERVKTELRSCWPMMLRYPESFHHRTCTRPRSRWRICFDDGVPEWNSEMYGDVRCRWRKQWEDVRRAEDEREDQTPAASMRRQISHQWGTAFLLRQPDYVRRQEYMVIIGIRIGLPGERSLEKFQKACRHCRPLVLGCSLTHAIFNTIAPLLLFPRPHTSFSLYGCHQEQHQPSDMAVPSTSANIIERCQPADQCLRHLQSYIGDLRHNDWATVTNHRPTTKPSTSLSQSDGNLH